MKEGYALRPYQESAVNYVENELLNSNNRSAIIVRSTGLGKTIIIAALVEKELERGGKILILAHRNSLLEQAHDKIKKACGIDCSFEGKKGGDERVVICSIQSMSRDNRLYKYNSNDFTLIIVDETHHIKSPSYEKVRNYFEFAKLVGVTATPVRGDGHDTREDFDVEAPIYTTEQAIEDGYLTPVHVAKIPLEIDISRVHMQGGDYSAKDVGNVLDRYLERIAIKSSEYIKGKKTIIFTPLVKTAEKLAEIFNEKTDLKADYVSGERKDSDDIMKAFENEEFDVLINSLLLTEGYDYPALDCVINLRPTRSKGLYVQMIGRALRLFPGKTHATVLDFLWQDNGRGRLNAQDALMENSDEFVRAEMEKYLLEGEEYDYQTLKEKAEKSAIDAREAALADAIEKANAMSEYMSEERRNILFQLTEYAKRKAMETGVSPLNIYATVIKSPRVRVKYHCLSAKMVKVKIEDKVLDDFGISMYECLMGDSTEQEPPTNKQLSFLEKFKIPVGYAVSKAHARFLIESLIERKELNLGSYKQVELLKRRGVGNASELTVSECNKLCNEYLGKYKKGKKKKEDVWY